MPGLRLASTSAGIKKNGRQDLVLMALDEGATTTAVFTRNAFCAAPVIVARDHLAKSAPRYLLINAGNANAGTGMDGLAAARNCCRALAGEADCRPEQVLPFSTGVIGEPLPVERIQAALPQLLDQLDADNWLDAACGMMTTDTVPKGVSKRVSIEDETVTVTGIVKGAGMIRPDMATMLAFIACDAPVSATLLHNCLTEAVHTTFDCITVDGDTSTNDACVLMATGKADIAAIDDKSGEAYGKLLGAVRHVCELLAQAVIRDAEGASKFITVEVLQGGSELECRHVAFAVAQSPLVKTAFFASDPNWGRILAAVGRAGVDNLDINAVSIYLDDVCIVKDGGRAAEYREAAGADVMARDEIAVRIVLGRGTSSARIWTSDLSDEYVRINAEYRT